MASGSSEIVRIYRSEDAVMAADSRLAEAGFPRRRVLRPGEGEDAVRAAARAGLIPSSQVRLFTQHLEEGAFLLAASAYFGAANGAVTVMESAGDAERPPEWDLLPHDPSPLSDALGIPTLSRVRSSTSLAKGFSLSGMFGIPLLINSAAPLSSPIGIPTLLKSKKNRTSSFGLPLLSKSATPLSSTFGLRVLSKQKRKTGEWRSSMGLPLLSKNPAPLSSMFGLQLLSNDKK